MDKIFDHFEKYISYILMAVAIMFVCYQVIDLSYHFAAKIFLSIQSQNFTVEEKGKPVAGLFFSILLTLEIIQTIKIFSHGHAEKVKIILIVGLIAVTRKILMFDMNEHQDPQAEFAIAALILALSAGYYLVSRNGTHSKTG